MRLSVGLQKQTWLRYNGQIILFNAHYFWATLLRNWTRCTDGFSVLLQRYVRKGIDAKNLAILSLNATFRSLFVQGFFRLTNQKLEPRTGNKFLFEQKIEIGKLPSKFQFPFSVKIENCYQVLIFVFIVDWKLKFEV